MSEIRLEGCTPTPLAHYLKAVGILRLISEQANDSCTGHWGAEQFVLRTSLDKTTLINFFVSDYEPSPMLAPWNGGSGFYSYGDKTGIEAIRKSNADRLRPFREALQQVDAVLTEDSRKSTPTGKEKSQLLIKLRAYVSDNLLEFFDAAIILAGDDPKFPPLLGSGGNNGNLDFTNNYMQRIVEVFDVNTGKLQPNADGLLRNALFGEPVSDLCNNPIGQFAPGNAGGLNSSNGFEGKARLNPWDYILMLEGAVVFAAAATRRFSATSVGKLSSPFTVYATGSGSGAVDHSDEASARGEMWMPLWQRPATYSELRVLFGEGRASLGKRAAHDGLDFARAVSKLGVERGIASFQRYSFTMRSGKAYFATPLDRIPVKRNPDSDLIDQLEDGQFLQQLREFCRKDSAPARSKILVRRLENALFECANKSTDSTQGNATRVQVVVATLGEIVAYLANSTVARSACPRLPKLNSQWVYKANDHSPEFRIAAGLAAIGAESDFKCPMIAHVVPIDLNRLDRFVEKSHLVTCSTGSLGRNLTSILRRRLIKWEGAKSLTSNLFIPLNVVQAFLEGKVDEDRVWRLFCGLVLVRYWRNYLGTTQHLGLGTSLPAAYCLLKPLFVSPDQLQRVDAISIHRSVSLPPRLIRMLECGQITAALNLGSRELRNAGLSSDFSNLHPHKIDGIHLLSALMLPIGDKALKSLLRRTRFEPQEETT